MSLYDDVDTKQVSEWGSSINKLMPQPTLTKIQQKKPTLLTPVVSLKPKVADENKHREIVIKPQRIIQAQPLVPQIQSSNNTSSHSDWDEFPTDEYNPAVPNEYEKIIKERRERNKKEDRKRHRSPSSGFGRRQNSDEEDNFRPAMNSSRSGTQIAPPKSLQESSPMIELPNISAQYGASAVAAKIMAKYGFKDGQGLGKQEQGISTALQVEKTSKRGGRIINEKEVKEMATPAQVQQSELPAPLPIQSHAALFSEQSITEMMKNPSKVILLRNMVGPGEVDDELEPEVKDECTTKYGEVITVHIMEMANQIPEETVRIFVEFSRIESAIKALVDLNGRFFGGRQVRCRFYSSEKYENFIFDQ